MKNKFLFFVSLLFGLVFINSGLNKFFNYMPMPEKMPEGAAELFGHAAAITWLLPLVAVAEIVGGLLVIFPKTRALGALIILPVMVGILLTHTFSVPEGLIMALILAIVLGWIIYENRNKYMHLLNAQK